MGKTFKRNSQFRPKKNGKAFRKDDQPWKKEKHQKHWEDKPSISSEDITQENFGS